MATFVLVHGAWRGSFGFRRIRREIQGAGHDASAPSLTGLGERAHLASPQVTLSTHVQDVVNHILFEDLLDIVLVGYSYGGAVVTGCLDHVHDRVRELVYLDAFVPSDGQCVADLLGLPRFPITLGQDSYLPAPSRSFDEPTEAAFQEARAVSQPIATAYDPVRLHQALDNFPFGRTYVKATLGDAEEVGEPHFRAAAEHAKTSNKWRYREIETNHMLLANRPHEVAALLLELAADNVE
jgi:pimeloyl-ACP methyl ester carboxylesterase